MPAAEGSGPHELRIDAHGFGAKAHPCADALRPWVDSHWLLVHVHLALRERLQWAVLGGLEDRACL